MVDDNSETLGFKTPIYSDLLIDNTKLIQKKTAFKKNNFLVKKRSKSILKTVFILKKKIKNTQINNNTKAIRTVIFIDSAIKLLI